MQKGLKLAIFDMDGVLLDSEQIHGKSISAMLDFYGAKPEDMQANIGLSSEEFWAGVIEKNSLWQLKIDDLVAEQGRRNIEEIKLSGMRESTGLSPLLNALEQSGVILGLASSSERPFVDEVVAYLGLEGRFSCSAAGSEANAKKPAPDLYRMVLEQAGVSPHEAAAVEDSRSGVAAAKAAGIFCIGYINPTSGKQDLSAADVVVRSLTEIRGILL